MKETPKFLAINFALGETNYPSNDIPLCNTIEKFMFTKKLRDKLTVASPASCYGVISKNLSYY